MTTRSVGVTALLLGLGLAGALLARRQDGFDHYEHRELFPSCTSCHAGAEEAGAPLWPAAADCATCHDGAVEERVTWTAPRATPASNLRFAHLVHRDSVAARFPADSAPPDCAQCHATEAGEPMAVARADPAPCLACHARAVEHLAVADTACATCHVPLAEARGLTEAQIKEFPAPPGHERPGYVENGLHGREAASPVRFAGQTQVAASCATCHARDFCTDCHVDAPETASIRALAADARSLAIPRELEAPASHDAAGFERQHGGPAKASPRSCATCHTQESCTVCHIAPATRTVLAMHASGPGRGAGAAVERQPPSSHVLGFADRHAQVASAEEKSCSTCHVRTECLDCHRPDPGSGSQFHGANFLARHPTAAYNRETTCADCHNAGQFCSTCHLQSGLIAGRPLGTSAKYHDAKTSFLFGHGEAARRTLESCVSCHTERDCLPCHSSLGGRRFNPHGPGFDPERLQKRNPEMCRACHGLQIPTRP
jgi:hypothetical protein